MSETITVSRVIPARAERIYTAWLDAAEHARMTASPATSGPDGQFTAWDGFISGATLESTPYTSIVQRWRSKDFPAGAPDSRLTVTLAEQGEGTLVTLTQANIPSGQGPSFEAGWGQWYFDPMTTYFSSVGAKLKGVGQAIEGAMEKTGEAVGQAFEEAGEQLQATAKEVKKAVTRATVSARKEATKAGKAVKKAVTKATVSARKEAAKAGKAVKKVEKKATARAGALRKKLQKALARKPAAKKSAPVKKKAALKKKVPARKKPAAKKKLSARGR